MFSTQNGLLVDLPLEELNLLVVDFGCGFVGPQIELNSGWNVALRRLAVSEQARFENYPQIGPPSGQRAG
jgi:hypothetical protein